MEHILVFIVYSNSFDLASKNWYSFEMSIVSVVYRPSKIAADISQDKMANIELIPSFLQLRFMDNFERYCAYLYFAET